MTAYCSSFDAHAYGFGTIQLSRSGSSSISVNIGTLTALNANGRLVHVFNHVVGSTAMISQNKGNPWFAYLSPELAEFSANPFPDIIQALLRVAAASAGWPNSTSITVTFDLTSLRYTIAYQTALSAITFGNANTRALFGFASNFSGSSASVTGALLPDFIVEATLPGVSFATQNYETEAMANAAVSGSGRNYGMSRIDTWICRDWTQQFEPDSKVHRLSSGGAFTYQELFETCRAKYPFGVIDGFGDTTHRREAFYLKDEAFSTERILDGDEACHVPFRAVVAGFI